MSEALSGGSHLADRDLIASSWMLAGLRPTAEPVVCPVGLAERARIAAEVGFKGIGLNHADLVNSVGRHGHRGVRTILDDHGIQHLELEVLMGWHLPGPAGEAAEAALRDMLEAAERIGVRHIKATGDFSGEVPAEALARPYAALTARARAAGTRIALEIVAFSNVSDIPTALAVIRDGDPAGGGLMLDCWHFARRGLGVAEIAALDPRLVAGVEVSDVGPEVQGSLFEDTIDHRRLCGDGAYDVAGFLAAVAATGYAGPVGAEVLSAELRALGIRKAARLGFAATRAACREADARRA